MQKKLFFVLFFLCNSLFATPLQWQTLAPGLEYTDASVLSGFAGKGVHVFRLDLQKYRLQLALTHLDDSVSNIANLVELNNAVIGINGGFFSPDMQPLGLRIDAGKIKNPLKGTSWWGVFYTQNSQPFITSPKSFRNNKNINFAIQSGPRLIVDGKITSLKPGVANRTALGITADGKVILLATSHLPLALDELAQIMASPTDKGGLNCVDALNLDGGSSTQLYAKVNNFKLNVPSLALVSDAVLVVPK